MNNFTKIYNTLDTKKILAIMNSYRLRGYIAY